MNRKAAIYSGTRFSMAIQLAPMQIGIRNTVSAISSSAMPSMPSAQANRPKIGAYSWNCHCAAAPDWSKFIQRMTPRSEEHTSELQSLMRISYAVFCLKKKRNKTDIRQQMNKYEKHCNTQRIHK